MKIAALFKSEVGFINSEYTAGAERVFLQDLTIFHQDSIPYVAYCAGKFIPKKQDTVDIKSLWYPRWVYKGLEKFTSNQYLGKIFFCLITLFDVIYCFEFILKSGESDLWYSYQTAILALFNPQKTVIAHHNFHTIPFYRLFKTRYLKANYYFCSKSLRDQYFRAYPDLKSSNWKVIYNGVDNHIFHPIKKRGNKHLTFLYTSSWRTEKGIFLLLKSIKKLEMKGLEASFYIAGSADLWYNDYLHVYQQIDRKIEEISLRLKNATLVGKINYNNLTELYSKVDCLILPSIWSEPFPLSTLEALSCGVPVIAFSVGGNVEIIKNNYNGFLLNEISSTTLTKKIIECSKNPIILNRLRPNCIKTARYFSLKKRKKLLLTFLETSLYMHN